MAGIGDSWGTKEELLHPRGPDGRWIRKAGVAKSIIGRVLDFLGSFRPRTFQSKQQSNQYLQNISHRAPRRFTQRDYVRLRSDLTFANADLRDGVIDEPSTKTFVEMMDQHATELPDDAILTRVVPVEAFGFDAQTAVGTDSQSTPGIRGLSGKLVADQGYSLTTLGGVQGAQPAGTVRMVIAAKKGTKVIVPGSSSSDSSIFMDRGQPVRVTKIQPDGAGGWIMYATADGSGGRGAPKPIGGPVGEGRRPSVEREREIRGQVKEAQRITSTRMKAPDEAAEEAEAARLRETAARVPPSAGRVEEERLRQQAQQPQQPPPPGTPPPRTEPVVTRAIGGEPRPETGPGGVPTSQAPGAAPEAPTGPRRAVDLRLAVRDSNIPAPAAGPNRKRFNDAYEGVISGKKDPIDAVRELDRDAADLEAKGDQDADNLRQLADVIRREYGLEQPAPAKKAAPRAAEPTTAPEVPEAPLAKKAPAKKAAGSKFTPAQEDALISRAQQFRGNERNDEERRIVGEADAILARRRGEELPPVKKAAPKKAAPAKALTPQQQREQDIKGLFGGKRPTNAQLREMGERNNLGFGSKEPRSEMILAILGARPSRGRQVGEVPVAAPVKKAAPSREDRVTDLLLERMRPDVRERILADMSEEDRRRVDEAVTRVREAGPPVKKVAKKAAPEVPVKKTAPAKKTPGDDLDGMTREELIQVATQEGVTHAKFKNTNILKSEIRRKRAPEAPAKKAAPEAPGDDLDKMTKAELLALAKREGVQRASSMNKDQLKAGILRMREIGPVEPGSSVGKENQVQELMGLEKKPTVAQLRAFAKERGLTVDPRDRRDQLIDTILAPSPRERADALAGPGVIDRMAEAGTEGEGVPEVPAKKAAKAAVPGAAPGTAAGKITAGRIQPGMKILVSPNGRATDRKTGARTLTVTGVDRVGPNRARGERNTRIQVHGTDENGNEVTVPSVGSATTFIVASEPGAAPAKKAAKAAVPEAVPAPVANLKIGKGVSATRIKPGDAVWVEPGKTADGKSTFLRTRKKTGSLPLTVTRNERESGNNYILHGTLPDGREVTTAGYFGQNTFYRVEGLPEGGVPETPAPVKKVAKAAAPAPVSGRDIAARLNTSAATEFPMSREQARELVDTLRTRAQLMEAAKEIGIPQASKKTMPELRREIVEGTIGIRLDSIATRGFRGSRPDLPTGPSGHPGDTGMAKALVPEEQARQVKLDRVKAYGAIGTEVDELITNGASPKALTQRIRTRGKQQLIPDEDMAPLIQAAEAGDNDRVRALTRQLMDREGITQIGSTDAIVPLDRENQESLAGRGLPRDTTMVRVVRPGSRAIVDGDNVLIDRAVVDPASPDEIREFEQGKRLVPEGSTAGDRTQATVDNEPRKRSFDEAWDAAGIEGEGAAGRSMKEIRDDVSSGKITPEEGIRRMEGEIAFNKEDLAEVDANLRQPDLSDSDRVRLQSDAAKLQGAIDEQEKASKFMRMYFKDEKPTVEEIKVTVDAEGFRALQEATPDTLRQAAKEQGLDPPKGETKDEILQDMIRQVAKKVAQERGLIPKKATKATKKVAKKAEPPKIPADREKLDIRTIGAGIDFDENDKWTQDRIAEAQKKLDEGKVTPAQVGRDLDNSVDAMRTHAAIQYGRWTDDVRAGEGPPDEGELAYRRMRNAQLEKLRSNADKIQELAERLKGTRRKPVKKAAKAAPEVKAAEARTDAVEARLINDHLERAQKARTREAADRELDGLTMPELRRIGEQMGVKGRSKRDLRDKILDRLKPEPPEPPTPGGGRGARTPAAPSLDRRGRDAGIETPQEQFSGAASGVQEAERRLKAGQSPTEVARFLRERAVDVSKADLVEEGRRFRIEHDKSSLRSIRKGNADWLRRLATMLQREEKGRTPTKKTAPAKKTAPTRDLGSELQVLARGTTIEERSGMRPALSVVRGEGRGGGRAVAPPEGSRRLSLVPPPAKKTSPSAPVKKAAAPRTKPEGTPFTGSRFKRELTDSSGRIIPRDRPNNDESLHLPNGGSDQGRVHMDSELGELWSDLYLDDREPNSFINEVARIGEQVGTGQLPLAQALERLGRMKERATDKAVEARIQRAIDAMDAPPVKVPDLPDTIPASIREALRRLSEIPTARSTKVRGISPGEGSVFDQKLDIIRRIEAGDEERRLDMMLRERDLHESVDGALEMWRLFEGIDLRELSRWRRDAYRRAHPE